MYLEQTIPEYNLSGNLPDLIVADVSGPINFTLHTAGSLSPLLEERYTPDTEGKVKVPLREILENIVPSPGFSPGDEGIPIYTFTAGMLSGWFRCVKGGHGANIPADVFFRNNFLTWQPQTRLTPYHAPHRLRYVALVPAMCVVTGYFPEGRAETVVLMSLEAGNIYTIDTSYGTIRGKFAEQPTYFDVWVESQDGQFKTWSQRYMLAETLSGENDYFVFENSLGGFDTIRFSGNIKEINEPESLSALFGEETLEYDVEIRKSFQKNTGYIEDDSTRKWVLDFFNSSNRFYLQDGDLNRIYVSKPKIEHTRGEVAGYEFTFATAKQSKYLSLPRVDVPELLKITDPAGEVFFLAPRLNQFELVDLDSADIMIPVQKAASNKWYALPAALIKKMFDNTGSVLQNLTNIFHPKEGRVTLDMHAKNLSAAEDTTTGRLVARQGVESDGFRVGWAGEGYAAWVDAWGQSWIETDNLSVRKKMHVFELTVQQVQYQSGIYIYSPAGMRVTEVEELIGSWRCYFDSQEGTVKNAFKVDDQGYCQRFEGSTKYYWRVVLNVGDDYIDLAKSGDDDNGLPLSDGDDIPEVGDVIVQLGNRTDPERQNGYIITTIGPNSPRSEWYKGVNAFSLAGKVPIMISPQENRFTGNFYLNGGFKPVESYIDEKGQQVAETVMQNITADGGAIDLRVSKKTENLATKTELSSALTIRDEQITATVGRVDEMGSQISSIKQTADNISLTVSGMKIGGVNLIPDSDFKKLLWGYSNGGANTRVTDPTGYWGAGEYVHKLVATGYSNGMFGPMYASAGQTYSYWVYVNEETSRSVNVEGRGLVLIPPRTWTRVVTTFNNNAALTRYAGEAGTFYFARIQLEDGNKATGWSLALEDMATQTQLSSLIEQTADKISLAVSAIQVGGVNLLRNSEILTVKSVTATGGGATMTADMVNGKQYTLSYEDTDIVVSSDYPQFYIWKGLWTEYIQYLGNVSAKTRTFVFGGPTGRYTFNVYNHIYPNGGEIRRIKLEEGNMSTAWSAAPEDVPNKLLATGIDIDNGKVEVTADQFTVKGRDGRQIMKASADGNVVEMDNVKVTGEIHATSGEFTGKITAESGKIGGFNVNGSGLTNDFNNDTAYMIFRYDPESIFAGIGTNVFPSYLGIRTAARFENGNYNSYGRNIALYVDARNGMYNDAICMAGGYISGFALNTIVVHNSMTLSHEHCYLSCYNTESIILTLPTPAAAQRGKVYYIKRMYSDVNISGKIWKSSEVSSTQVGAGIGDTVMLVNDGNYWCYNYMGR